MGVGHLNCRQGEADSKIQIDSRSRWDRSGISHAWMPIRGRRFPWLAMGVALAYWTIGGF